MNTKGHPWKQLLRIRHHIGRCGGILSLIDKVPNDGDGKVNKGAKGNQEADVVEPEERISSFLEGESRPWLRLQLTSSQDGLETTASVIATASSTALAAESAAASGAASLVLGILLLIGASFAKLRNRGSASGRGLFALI